MPHSNSRHLNDNAPTSVWGQVAVQPHVKQPPSQWLRDQMERKWRDLRVRNAFEIAKWRVSRNWGDGDTIVGD